MATIESSATGPATAEQVPELHAGDRLTRAEFERRYAAMPQVEKNMAHVMAVLQQGLASAEHAQFVGRLAAAPGPAT